MDEVSSSCMLYPSATPPQPNGSSPVGGNASDVDDLSCQNAICMMTYMRCVLALRMENEGERSDSVSLSH